MSLNSPILATHGWHRHEHKYIDIEVLDSAGDPVSLLTADLDFKILKEQGSASIYLTKSSASGITVIGADFNIARVEVNPNEYDDLDSGTHYYELWDREADALLAFGDATVLEGSA